MAQNISIESSGLPNLSRRDWLTRAAYGIGSMGIAAQGFGSQLSIEGSPLAAKKPHHPPRAKRLIFLHMRGGPSHMETFEYKPELYKKAGEDSPKKGRKLVGKNWDWIRRGQSGLWVSELLPNMARHADDLCVLSGMHTDSGNHTPAMLQLHTGSFQFTRPSLGAWLMYGLGTPNANLPGFVSMCPPVINGGAKNYSSAFLPAVYQGTAIGNIKVPIAKSKVSNLKNPYLTTSEQKKQLAFIQQLNHDFANLDPSASEIEGIIESYERAFQMQGSLPEMMDVDNESAQTLEMYGIGKGKKSDNFGRQCLIARKMIEAGVRHVEVCDEFWDQHNNLVKGHNDRAAATDKPIGGLLSDLKRRGLLEDTLVVWGGEFGRSPDTKNGKLDGRDHNPSGYTMVLAGGGVKGGFQYGATDELGFKAVDGRVHLHDLHATILHIMGLDHESLTYRYAGRDFRLTDVHGRVVREILI